MQIDTTTAAGTTRSATAHALLAALTDTFQPQANHVSYDDCPAILIYHDDRDQLFIFDADARVPDLPTVVRLFGEEIDAGTVVGAAYGSRIEVRRAVAWHGPGEIASTAPYGTFTATA